MRNEKALKIARKQLRELEKKVKPYMSEMNNLRSEILKIQRDKNKLNIGKCFKFKNNYSCPESDEDYWWVYYKIIKAGSEKYDAISFQKTADNMFMFIDEKSIYLSEGYIEISEEEYDRARMNYLVELHKFIEN